LAESLGTALVSAKRFEIEIKEKVSTKTLNKVILLKRVLLTSIDYVGRNCRMMQGINELSGRPRRGSNDEGARGK